jgi:hypothetical protein
VLDCGSLARLSHRAWASFFHSLFPSTCAGYVADIVVREITGSGTGEKVIGEMAKGDFKRVAVSLKGLCIHAFWPVESGGTAPKGVIRVVRDASE